jgi:CheY-like chemotaxis protein
MAPKGSDTVDEQPAASEGIPQPGRRPATARGILAMKTVLVIEDDKDLRELVAMMLEDAGLCVLAAGNGQEGLDRVQMRMPDLILLDMKMPVMNGWQFAAEFRARYGAAAPIVVITAAEHASLRAQEIGAVGWISKPFEMDEFIKQVKALAPA